VPVDELVMRVKKKPDKRPLLKNRNIDAKMQELVQSRGPIYETARLKVDVSGGTHEDAIDRLLRALSAHYG
jgi:shikimate kinase